MLGKVSTQELLIVLLIVLVIFGPKQAAQIGKNIWEDHKRL